MSSEQERRDRFARNPRGLLGLVFEHIDTEEQEGWKAFVEEHKDCYKHTSGNGISIVLQADSIGGYLITMQCKCGESSHITNFAKW